MSSITSSSSKITTVMILKSLEMRCTLICSCRMKFLPSGSRWNFGRHFLGPDVYGSDLLAKQGANSFRVLNEDMVKCGETLAQCNGGAKLRGGNFPISWSSGGATWVRHCRGEGWALSKVSGRRCRFRCISETHWMYNSNHKGWHTGIQKAVWVRMATFHRAVISGRFVQPQRSFLVEQPCWSSHVFAQWNRFLCKLHSDCWPFQ